VVLMTWLPHIVESHGISHVIFSPNLQMARISNFACDEPVVGRQCTHVFFTEICKIQLLHRYILLSTANLQSSTCAEDPLTKDRLALL